MASPTSPSLALSSSLDAFPVVHSGETSQTGSSVEDIARAVHNSISELQEEYIPDDNINIDLGEWDDNLENDLMSMTHLYPDRPSEAPSQLGQPRVAPLPSMVPPLPNGPSRPWRSHSSASRKGGRDEAASDADGSTPRRHRRRLEKMLRHHRGRTLISTLCLDARAPFLHWHPHA